MYLAVYTTKMTLVSPTISLQAWNSCYFVGDAWDLALSSNIPHKLATQHPKPLPSPPSELKKAFRAFF